MPLNEDESEMTRQPAPPLDLAQIDEPADLVGQVEGDLLRQIGQLLQLGGGDGEGDARGQVARLVEARTAAVDDGEVALCLRTAGVVAVQQLAGADRDIAAVGDRLRNDQRPRGHRQPHAAAVGQLGQLERRRVGAAAGGDVQAPQVAVQVAGVDGVGGAVGHVEQEGAHMRHAGRVARAAGTGADLLEQRPGARVDDEEVALAVGVVVARREDHHPAVLLGLDDGRFAIGEAQVGIAELPQHAGRDGGFAGHRRTGR